MVCAPTPTSLANMPIVRVLLSFDTRPGGRNKVRSRASRLTFFIDARVFTIFVGRPKRRARQIAAAVSLIWINTTTLLPSSADPHPKQRSAPMGKPATKQTSHDRKVADFLAQKRIAVAGVSRQERQHPVGNLIARRLRATGHEVFPVNPAMSAFDDIPCYPDLKSIPGGADGVVIVTRPEITERVVRQCGEAGIRRVWMHQSTADGSSVSPDAIDYCRGHGISVIAGACPMMYGPGADFGHLCMRYFLRFTGGLPP